MTAERIAVVVDTDIGSNIDDALCLAYLLKHPQCELLGITTVTGEPTVRAQLASAVCTALGQPGIPIHAGSAKPLLVPSRQPEARQKTVLAHWAHQERFRPHTAIDFLREMIHAWPGEITLLSIGPLTNTALLFGVDPEIPRLLKRHVLMGGVYLGPVPRYGLTETNTSSDPHAAAIVLAADTPVTRCLGLDVTTQCVMDAQMCRARFRESGVGIIVDLAEVWFEERSEIIFHDPLAAVVIFQEDLCRFQAGLVSVEYEKDAAAARTRFDPHAAHRPHEVAVEVNAEGFFTHFFGTR